MMAVYKWAGSICGVWWKKIKWKRIVKSVTEVMMFTFDGTSQSCTLEPWVAAQTHFKLLTLSKEQTAHSFQIFVHKHRKSSLTTGKRNSLSFHMSSVFGMSFTHGYLLCRLPEVSGVRQPAVQLGQLLQHVGQLGEGRPVPQVVRPAGGENLLRAQPWVRVLQWGWRMGLLLH